MNLVIVESPAKSKTIEKYLGNDYKVVSSKGHIRELAPKGKFGLGIDVNNNFTPTYEIIKGKNKDVANLKKLVKEADHIYLATDPDREGEAISWHLFDELKIKEKNYDRVLFYEITKNKVLEGLSNPRKIDYDLVNSQKTRSFLDRIIGFRLSTLMRAKKYGDSAGRVQSVAVKLVVDREREIEAFIPTSYFSIRTKLTNGLEIELKSYKDSKDDLTHIESREVAENIKSELSSEYRLVNIDKKEKERTSKDPFTTSTLQQTASYKLNMAPKKTMEIAQKLYEGKNVGSETTGLITYMRTDSIRLSDDFIKPTYDYIEKNYGKEYIGIVHKLKKSDNIQDGHEAIRPTSIYRTPESIKKYLDADEYKLYSLIYYRALASLMAKAKTLTTTLVFDNNNYKFTTSGTIVTFDGYLKVYSLYEDNEDIELDDYSDYINMIFKKDEINIKESLTKGPSRYTEATLIKELEEKGIGRPSTYATIMSTIKERKYVELIEKKFHATKSGIKITDALQQSFNDFINVEYTSNMEKDLDLISEGKLNYLKLLNDFYPPFEERIESSLKEMESFVEKTGNTCPECGAELVIRKGKYGEFEACSNYPECKYIKTEEKKVEYTGENCPHCNSPMIYKKGRYGNFEACSNYPECKYIKGQDDKKEEKKDVVELCHCPRCKDGILVLRTAKRGKTRGNNFYGCNKYPKCKTIATELEDECSKCHSKLILVEDMKYCPNCQLKK